MSVSRYKIAQTVSVFNVFLNNARDAGERTASGKLFQTEVAAAEKHLPPMLSTNNTSLVP